MSGHYTPTAIIECYAPNRIAVLLRLQSALAEDIAKLIHSRIHPEEPWEDCPGMQDDHWQLAADILAMLPLREAADQIEEMAAALKQCRDYLANFGSVDPKSLKQQIDDALAMYELREAQANAELAEKSA